MKNLILLNALNNYYAPRNVVGLSKRQRLETSGANKFDRHPPISNRAYRKGRENLHPEVAGELQQLSRGAAENQCQEHRT